MTLFVFEGLPRCGKTTLIRELSKDLNALHIYEIMDKNCCELLPSEIGAVTQRFFFNNDARKYALAKKYAHKKIVIMDRGYLSTIAYNLCLIKSEKQLLKKEKQLSKKYRPGTIYIYIRISPEMSMARRKKKPNNPEDMWSYFNNLCETEIFYEQRLNNSNTIAVDGSLSYRSLYSIIRSFILQQENAKARGHNSR